MSHCISRWGLPTAQHGPAFHILLHLLALLVVAGHQLPSLLPPHLIQLAVRLAFLLSLGAPTEVDLVRRMLNQAENHLHLTQMPTPKNSFVQKNGEAMDTHDVLPSLSHIFPRPPASTKWPQCRRRCSSSHRSACGEASRQSPGRTVWWLLWN